MKELAALLISVVREERKTAGQFAENARRNWSNATGDIAIAYREEFLRWSAAEARLYACERQMVTLARTTAGIEVPEVSRG